jgi:hypothetical protein
MISNAYLSSPSRSAIKALTGFDVKFQANYYLPRAKEEPSEESARQVWPQIDGWLRQFDEGTIKPGLAEWGFLKPLKRLRDVFLGLTPVSISRITQSGPILSSRRRNTPSPPERVVTGLNDVKEPHLTQIERANPLVANELQTLGRTIASPEISIWLEITR